jgi:hypothetical protein
MSVSFTTLFERSRLSVEGRRVGLDDRAAQQHQEQRERFAVAAIGFALEHDSVFRSHFIGDVCGLKDISGTNDWNISVELDNWGDLVLKHEASRSLLIAEFKIGADLQDHQNPEKPQFELPRQGGQCAGYGWEIKQLARAEKWTRVQYVTVEERASWQIASRKRDGQITCIPVEWRRFLRSDASQESPLEEDLYDCLGRFGVIEFIARKMNKIKIADVGTVPFAILLGVLAKFGVKFQAKLLNQCSMEEFGFNVMPQDFPGVGSLGAPEGQGWFGYASYAADGTPPGPHLYVELWYGAAVGDKSAFRDRIESALLKSGLKRNEFLDEGWGTVVFRPAGDESTEGDMEWFVRVLGALNGAGRDGSAVTDPNAARPKVQQADTNVGGRGQTAES